MSTERDSSETLEVWKTAASWFVAAPDDGSVAVATIPTLSESLAGRAAFVDLWPLSAAERFGAPSDFVDRLFTGPQDLLGQQSAWTRRAYLDLLCSGSYPEVARQTSALARRAWFDAYVDALETIFTVEELTSWSGNLSSRATKMPKPYLTDSGMAAHLLQVSPEDLMEVGHPALGGLVETFIFTELIKLRALTTRGFRLYHYRDRDSREIDFVCEGPGRRVVAIEVKASQSPGRSDTRHLAWLRDKLGERFVAGVVLYLGTNSLSLGDRLMLLPVSALWGHLGGAG